MWGLVYVLSEQLYKTVSVPTVLAVQMVVAAAVMLFVAFGAGGFREDVGAILSSRYLLLLILASIVAWVAADFLIAYSIAGKNASLAGLIEISYPLFIVLFAYLIFGEAQLSVATAFGGVLIFVGIGIIFSGA